MLRLTNMGRIDVLCPFSDYRHRTVHDHHKASGRETLWFRRPKNKAIKPNLRRGKCTLTHISSSQREGHSCAAA
jgi:hypothetical protein